MTPTRFAILTALVNDVLHGAAIARRAEVESAGRVKLWPVTLYRDLDGLEEDGLIREVTDPEEQPGPGGRHRFFRLTDMGRAALSAEAQGLERFAGRALAKLRAREKRA